MTRSRLFQWIVPAVAAATILLLFVGHPLGATNREQEKKPAPPPAVDASKYVGSDTCKTCHEDLYKNFEKTPHWKTTFWKRAGSEAMGCESCHGPGADHVNGGGDKTKIFIFKGATTKQISERCLDCHQYGEEHSNFTRSMHRINDVSCIDCHSPHRAKESQFLLVQAQPQLCYSCHLELKPQFSKPFRHRVNEKLVKCTDCHNQHGGFMTRQLRSTAAQDQVCFKCHADKAGPFVFEHHGIKPEGCVSCHLPHGSSNPRLLKRSQINVLCLECHSLTTDSGPASTPTFHNQAQKYQACTMCHVAIHGSNFDRFFFK